MFKIKKFITLNLKAHDRGNDDALDQDLIVLSS